MRNLARLVEAGLPAPPPVVLRNHVLVMQFIGTAGVPAHARIRVTEIAGERRAACMADSAPALSQAARHGRPGGGCAADRRRPRPAGPVASPAGGGPCRRHRMVLLAGRHGRRFIKAFNPASCVHCFTAVR